jgi:NAD+ kinase
MATVGLIVHHEQAKVADAAGDAARWLLEQGHEVRLPEADAARADLPDLAVSGDDFGAGLDVLVSFGGDGTMLRAVDLVAPHGIPVIGVNFGQLGYLTEVEPTGVIDALERFFRDEYAIEERMMLSITLDAPDNPLHGTHIDAFNEAVLERAAIGHTVRLDVTIDDLFFTPYATDGLSVATATGSTAYSFSARGPIMAPTLHAMLLTPVSPHMLFDRPLVLEATTTVRLAVSGHRPAMLSVDGRTVGELRDDEAIVCTGSDRAARLVTFAPRDFHLILKAKFGLSDR